MSERIEGACLDMAAVAGSDWPRPSSALTSQDASSPMFPERPIRPLPKRKIRSRLSEDEANSIGRPLDPSSPPPVFGSRAAQRGASNRFNNPSANRNNSGKSGRQVAPGAYESDEDREEDGLVGQRATWNGGSTRYPHDSTTSSIDGESFENTNNKKKRKIPLHHGSNFPIDANDSDSNYGPSTAAWQLDGSSPAHSASKGPLTTNRGRGVRTASKGKQPLATSLNGLNNVEALDSHLESSSKNHRVPHAPGQENNRTTVSQQAQQTGQHTNKFTFDYPSSSSKQLSQASHAGMPSQQISPANTSRGSTTQGTQTLHNPVTSAGQRPPANNLPQPQPAPHGSGQPDSHVEQPSEAELLYRQAVDRRRTQRMHNRRKDLRREDVVVCDFCLYEELYGARPRHLKRDFEKKHLKRRQEEENRRRLLEKAKAKSRKTRKAGRAGQNSKNLGPHQNQSSDQVPYDSQYDHPGHDPQSPGDDFYDDDYDEVANTDEYADGTYEDEYPPPLDPVAGAAPTSFSDPTSPSSPSLH